MEEVAAGLLADAFGRRSAGHRARGVASVPVPWGSDGRIDWAGFEGLVDRARRAGLEIAVNLHDGCGDLLDPNQRLAVLDATRRVLGPGRGFLAGAWPLRDGQGEARAVRHQRSLAEIQSRGATAVIVSCESAPALPPPARARLLGEIAAMAEGSLALEISPHFALDGEIWSDETFARILDIDTLAGVVHLSLDRATELRRLFGRDERRAGFALLGGNPLATDMVAYGGDYLLGLAALAPRAFAARDRALTTGDVSFLERDAALQHLGNVVCRAPLGASRHASLQFLHLTGQISHDAAHPSAERRPASERHLLFDCAVRLGMLEDPAAVWQERVEPWISRAA